MTLAATSTALGVSLAASAGSVDPTGVLRWAAIASALGTWFPASVSFVATSFTGTAGAISGTTAFVFSASDLGAELAEAAQSTDAAGLAAWGRVGNAIISHCQNYGQANATGLTYTPGGTGLPVPVIGTGTVQFTDTTSLGAAMASAAGSVDAAGIAAWTSIATQILSWLTTNGQVMPTLSGVPTTILDGGGACIGGCSLQ